MEIGIEKLEQEVEELKNNLIIHRSTLDSSIFNMKLCNDRLNTCTKENTELKKEMKAGSLKIVKLEDHFQTLTGEYNEMVKIIRVCFPDQNTSSIISLINNTSETSPDDKPNDEPKVFSRIKKTVMDLIEQRNNHEKQYEERELEAYNLRNEYYVICEKVKILKTQKDSLNRRYKELCENLGFHDSVSTSENSSRVFNTSMANARVSDACHISINDKSQEDSLKIVPSIEDKMTKLKSTVKNLRQYLQNEIIQNIIHKKHQEELATDPEENLTDGEELSDFPGLEDIKNVKDDSECIRNLANFLNCLPSKIKLYQDELCLLSKESKELEYALRCRRLLNETRNLANCRCGTDLASQKEKLIQLQNTANNYKTEVDGCEAQLESMRNIFNLILSPEMDFNLSDILPEGLDDSNY